jgi:ATP-dependent DNA helicase PIF1
MSTSELPNPDDASEPESSGPLPAVDNRPRFEFLTGTAGTGKTFLARQIAEECGATLCATTGIAAINLGAGTTTINSLLGYFDTASLRDIWTTGRLTSRLGWLWNQGLTRLVIDEVSMMNGEQLEIICQAVDELEGSSRQIPLGITLVGDFCQLPPVQAPFAFEAECWSRFAGGITKLEEIRRQTDREFVAALQAVRRGDARRALEYFGPLLQRASDPEYDGPTVLAKNIEVDRYNLLRHAKVQGELHTWRAHRWVAEGGKPRSEWKLIPDELKLKTGALVMVLANEREEDELGRKRGPYIYVNGDLGEVVDGGPFAAVKLRRSGKVVGVSPVVRESLVKLDKERRKHLRETGQEHLIRGDHGEYEATAGISYMPLRLAYATTCHKSQGLTLDQVQVSIFDRMWETGGMVYVALSRARTAAGLRIVGSPELFAKRIQVDQRVKGWV